MEDDGLRVLALNSGSSSLKFALLQTGPAGIRPLLSGEAQSLGAAASPLRVRDADGRERLHEREALADTAAAAARVLRLFDDAGLPAPQALGHRVVHGGLALRHHARIDAGVLAALEAAVPFAPLHVPAALAAICAARARFPDLPQVACLDTAFHADLPAVARTLPLARELREQGVQRFGFHGLSCASILAQWQGPLPARLVIAHLGAGASITAVQAGRSVDTSMGMTPSGGIMMATRSGDLDPGVLAWLARERGFDAAAMERLIDHHSGLLGVSGVSADLRDLRASDDPAARLAIAMFEMGVRKAVAGMAAALGGLDALVFTGGIGEHDAATRAAVCEGLAWAGIALDPARNREHADPLSRPGSTCLVRALPTQEERQIARHTRACLEG